MILHDILDARQEFKNFYILLSQDQWFNKVCSSRQLEDVLKTCHTNDNQLWEYDVSKLEFKNISLDKHIRPLFVTSKAKEGHGVSSLILSVSCGSNPVSQIDRIEDPIASLALKFHIKFEYLCDETDALKLLQSCWHLDKHDAERQTTSSHPLYHYEFGGKEISKNKDFNYGDFIIIDTPRIMHPPMDIVLAIDFVVKHYYSYEEHKTLTEKALYKRYLNNARFRIWRPYAISFASNFHNFGDVYEINDRHAMNLIHCEPTAKLEAKRSRSE